MKSIKTAAIIAALCSLIMIQPTLARDLLESEKEIISSAVMDHLQDPESAIFKWPPFFLRRQDIYCGLVNSRNRRGVYTGDMPYLVLLTWIGKEINTVMIGNLGDGDPESPATVGAWKFCKEFGQEKLLLAEKESCDACDDDLMESCEVDEDGTVKEETCILFCPGQDDQCDSLDSVDPR